MLRREDEESHEDAMGRARRARRRIYYMTNLTPTMASSTSSPNFASAGVYYHIESVAFGDAIYCR